MALTAAQEEHKAKLKAMEGAALEYVRLRANCPHAIVNKDDSAICEVCDKDFGWYCPDSPDHLCRYEGGDEFCTYCGDPEERK